MDATQRIAINNNYEGVIVTPHISAVDFYMYLYDKKKKKMLPVFQNIASDKTEGAMRYKHFSYVFEDAKTTQPALLSCTRTSNTDEDSCKTNCFLDQRIEAYTFNGEAWLPKFTLQKTMEGQATPRYNVECKDAALRKTIYANRSRMITHFFRK